jgi:maltooligosyltrehalose trehalohydrolase
MDAQWVDEFHHALRVATGKEPVGYFSDFAEFVYLGKAFADAYVYDGQYSNHRQKTFGRKTTGLSGDRFIVFSQNHDQIGNTMLGERTSKLVHFETLKLLAGAVICSPYVPMLFMGEEYGEHQPFQYFVSHQGQDLIHAVRTGRRNEFAAFFKEGESVPDPQAEKTFSDSKLRWESIEHAKHRALFLYYKELIRLRKSSVVLSSARRENLTVAAHETERCLVVNRQVDNHQMLAIFNFSTIIQQLDLPHVTGLHCLIDSTSQRWGGDHLNDALYTEDFPVQPMAFMLFSTEHV